MRKLAFLPAILLLLVSCTSLNWIENPYEFYPRDSYICGVGSGDSYERASLNAKKEIASLFGTAVSQSMSRIIVENNVKTEDVFELVQEVEYTSEDLYGIEIVEDIKKNGKYTVLAVMPKKTTSRFYKSRLDLELSLLDSKKEEVNNLLGSFKAIDKSIELIDYCKNCNTLAATCSFLSNEEIPLLNIAEYRELYRKAVDEVVVEIKVTGDDTDFIKSALSKAVTEAGFAVANGERQGTAVAEAVVSWKNTKGVGNAEGFVFAYYNAEISISDYLNKEKLFVVTLDGKEGHGNVSEAHLRAAKKIAAQMGNFTTMINEKYTRVY